MSADGVTFGQAISKVRKALVLKPGLRLPQKTDDRLLCKPAALHSGSFQSVGIPACRGRETSGNITHNLMENSGAR